MAKTKSAYFCQSCGFQSPKWLGKCPSCNQWNSFVEEIVVKSTPGNLSKSSRNQSSTPRKLSEITISTENRFKTPDEELNRVLGGGIVQGSVILLGGEPGIGKSTLLLQTALQLNQIRILYVSGEESEQQIKLRAERTGIQNDSCLILTETSLESILLHMEQTDPDLVVIDSVQTLHTETVESSAGSVSQIRECSSRLIQFAKQTAVPVILVGHINKEGSIAGPKILEHMVDVVLQFEGDRNHLFRIVRSLKNRFGSTSEIGIYEMRENGLSQVANPSALLMNHSDSYLSGTSVAATMEGLRPLLVEVQSLVSTAVYGTPQRSSNGFDTRRLNMLLAVLEKRCGFHLGSKDVFLNITGGLRIEDPAIDLAIVAAILSSGQDIPVPRSFAFAGEVGLTGEIRPVSRIEARISECHKLGFERIFVSGYNLKGLPLKKFDIEVTGITKIDELFRTLLS